MNHNNSRFTSFTFSNGELSSGNLSRMLSSPMAESTQLESGAGSSRGNLFTSPTKQGGAVKRKPTSPLLSGKTSFKSSGNLSTAGLSRIDPQVYTDAQSRGLVNRLIKYNDKTQSPLNRSQSMTNLYSKPGQFPVVHLKKTEIKYSPRRNNSITSVRIAPPEKSVFQANTRSNILRAGSLLIPAEPQLKAVRPQEVEIDAENRVIAPTAEVEGAPTRSVLDALKEISRKRINNEELDADRIKKQCKELSEVDSGGTGVKRARELTSSASPPSRGSSEQQLQKKRLCNKNNDISSSLSSSLVMNTPKRVDNVQLKPGRLNVDQSFSQMLTPAAFNATIATDNRIERKEPVKLSRIESAPLPQVAKIIPEMRPPVTVKPQPVQPKITLFNKKYDETQVRPVLSDHEEQEEDDELGGRISFIKPKDKSPIVNSEKVALKRVEKSKLSLILSCLSEGFDEEDEPPKQVAKVSILVKDTVDAPPKIEEKQEEIPAPKLSGLSALINNPIKDPGLGKIEPIKQQQAKTTLELPKTTSGFTFGTTPATTTSAIIAPKLADTTFTFGTPTKPAASEVKSQEKLVFGTPTPATVVSKSEQPPPYSFPTAVTASTQNQVTSSSFALTPAASPAATSLTTSAATPPTPSLISFSPAPQTKPVENSGFAIQASVSTNAPAGSIQAPATSPSGIKFGISSGFGAFKPPASTSASPATTTTSSNTLPSFGSTTAAAPTGNSAGFTFGTSIPKLDTTVTTASAFAFGSEAAAKPLTVAVAPTPPTTAAPSAAVVTTNAPVFGGFGTTTTSSSPSFSFGATTTAAPAFGTSTSTVTSSFGSQGNVTTHAFGGFGTSNANATSATATTTATATFGNTSASIFGGAAPTKTASPNQSTFGQISANSTFTFGSGAGATATALPAASQPTSQSNNAFAFGGTASNTTTSPTNPPNIFGSASAASSNNAMSTFGAVAASGGIPSFGAVSSGNPPAFGAAVAGGNNNPPAFGASNSAGAGGFGATPVFGAGSNASTTASSVFGGSSNTAPAAASPFGSSTAAAPSASNIFGGASNNNQATTTGTGAFAFGGSSNTSSTTAPNAAKPFAFGGAVNNTNNTQTHTAAPIKSNSFTFSAGTGNTAPAATPLAGSNSAFGFAASSNNNNNNNNNPLAPPPAFGSTNSAFSFSASANNSSGNINQATVKPFSFGGSANNRPAAAAAAPSGGIFGGNAATAVAPPPAFNFSAGSNPSGAFSFNSAAPAAPGAGPFGMPNGGVAPGAAPMFSIGTGGNNPSARRPMRQATRRLK